MHGGRGLSLVEVVVVLAIVGIAAAVVLPDAATIRDSGRTEAAARQLALTFQASRWKSVARRKCLGVWFELQGSVWVWWTVEDGNGNGLRTTEIRDGTDPLVSGPHRIDQFVEGVRMGFPPGAPFPEIPPDRGPIRDISDPVQFGRSDIVSFSPQGSSSSGRIYVTDGQRTLCAVVLFGPTSRVRVWRYLPWDHRWSL
jgi:prepilin-type N-terminal cleavage/methylation domain-containing protein